MPHLSRPAKGEMVRDRLRRWIREQGLMPGDQILSQNQLAKVFGVAGPTVHRAMTALVDEGILRREQGKGTFVATPVTAPVADTYALVLPPDGVSDPLRNPNCWHLVQGMTGALSSVDGVQTVSIVSVPDNIPGGQFCAMVSGYSTIFFHSANQFRQQAKALAEEGRARVVLFNSWPTDSWSDRCVVVNHDRRDEVFSEIRYLVERGYRRIAYIGSAIQSGPSKMEGYRLGLEWADLPYEPSRVVTGIENQSDGALGAERLLEQTRDVDAVFVDTDQKAIGAIDHFRTAGLRVPDDMGVIGYDGIKQYIHAPPYLTTLRVPWNEMVRAALSALEPGDNAGRRIMLTGNIAEGRTVRSSPLP